MTVTATTLAGRAGGRRRLSDSCLRYKKQEKSKSRRLRRHLGTSAPFFLLRGPLPLCLPLQASAAAECNAVHCRPNTVSNNRFTTHTHTPPPVHEAHCLKINITHTPHCRGSWLTATFPPLCGSRCVSISLPANEINDGVMLTLSAPAAHGKWQRRQLDWISTALKCVLQTCKNVENCGCSGGEIAWLKVKTGCSNRIAKAGSSANVIPRDHRCRSEGTQISRRQVIE